MQFGLGQQTSGSKFDWSHIHRHMVGRWPALTLQQTSSYAELVMAQLSEPANDKPFFSDGISKNDVLQHHELNKVQATASSFVWIAITQAMRLSPAPQGCCCHRINSMQVAKLACQTCRVAFMVLLMVASNVASPWVQQKLAAVLCYDHRGSTPKSNAGCCTAGCGTCHLWALTLMQAEDCLCGLVHCLTCVRWLCVFRYWTAWARCIWCGTHSLNSCPSQTLPSAWELHMALCPATSRYCFLALPPPSADLLYYLMPPACWPTY